MPGRQTLRLGYSAYRVVIEHKEYLFSGVGLIHQRNNQFCMLVHRGNDFRIAGPCIAVFLLIVQLNIKEQERAAQYWAALKLAASTIAVNVSEVRKSLFERPTAFQQKSPYR
ncbi:hypothetical protein A3848_21675 [Paenibacillus sp. P32E]|nr:hypothetical protein A3848_21675 [Paenibacillus sp. P32E]